MEKKKAILQLLREMISNIEEMPPQGMIAFTTHYDLLSLLILVEALFLSDCKDES